MSNFIKSGTTTLASVTRSGFSVGVDTAADYGPTNITGFYNGITAPNGGYTIYVTKPTGGPSIHVAYNDSQCIFFLKSFGSTGTTISEVLTWANAQNNIWVSSSDLVLADLTPAPSGTVFTSPTTSPNVTTVSQSPFSGGGNSYSLNGSNSYLSLSGNSSWAVGTGDFTIEWFQYQTDNNSFPRIFAIGSYPSTIIGSSIEGGTFYAWCPGANSFGSVSVKNAWHHFAIVRRSSNLYVYLNGSQISTAKSNTSNISNSSTTLYLGVENGGNSGTWFGGYLTNFRWVKGLAVYTGNFTKPTSSLTLTSSANPYGGSNTVAIPNGYTKLLLVP